MSEMDINAILKYLPHRYPFLLIDRVLECSPGESLTAVKNISYNEPFFQGHFPHRPVMPAVLILEAMAQATGLLVLRTLDTMLNEKTIYYFVGVNKARFRQPVEPGDQLIIEAKLVRSLKDVFVVTAEVKVAGKLVASAELMGALRDLAP